MGLEVVFDGGKAWGGGEGGHGDQVSGGIGLLREVGRDCGGQRRGDRERVRDAGRRMGVGWMLVSPVSKMRILRDRPLRSTLRGVLIDEVGRS